MEKLNFIERQIDKWVSLPPTKKISYLTGVIIVALSAIIYFGFIHYENKITKLENDNTKLRNESTITLNGVIARYESSLAVEKEKSEDCWEYHIKYVEKNEREVKDLVFYTEKYKKSK